MISNSSMAEEFWSTGRRGDCPVIDMHAHMGPWPGIFFPDAAPEAMVARMDQCGVRMLAFCHHAALFCPEIGNAASVDAVRRFPDRLRAYLGVNPHYPRQIAADLAGWEAHRDVYVGLKLLAGYHQVPWDAPAYRAAWEFADARGLLMLLHTWAGSRFDGADMVRRMAPRYGRARLLLGHSLHGDWESAIALAREFPNIWLELTAVLDDRGVLEKFCAAGLSKRLLFGTDLPWFNPHHGIGAVLSADITDDDRHDILHRNAESLLGMGTTEGPGISGKL